MRTVLREHLTKHGFQVVLTGDLTRAIMLHNMKPLDAMLIDVDSAGQRGLDDLKAMNKDPKNHTLKFVFMARQKGVNQVAAIAPNRSTIMLKPCNFGPVYQALTELVPRS